MEKETAVFICVFYGFLHHSGYEKIFPLNEQRCCRCRAELTSLCEIESLVVCVFDPEKRRAIKKKRGRLYTEANTNQEMHLHLKMRNTGKQNQ